ncbi:hypothetical protein NAEGRDRAFT_81431 [Naegleria gruberi]|uniref:Uncharacterized protein n=1 Tax=Naegleria gruberi TaxID=5762 RepID=D2VVY7_NAEGR|nr:uncharacterized protein NAEGRDRAFT_81431 [Naegleria gruberi]EFC38983.1 hypothetical protein NAEGRDRAFT_81431 [Naegleria gruberi]|eukprot:XP_002671727.1 hypothetical protein NAEGRDRAFT_81431 [Naegleria gruberi strain NEG-M]
MTQFQTWYLIDHFCDILQINFAEILKHDAFKDRCLKKIDLVQILFKDFQSYTITHKDYKGFPTTTASNRSSSSDENKDLLLPRSTRLPKSHEVIDKMFKLYFTNRKNHIRDALEREIRQGPVKLVDENSIRYIDLDEEEKQQPSTTTKKRKASEALETTTPSTSTSSSVATRRTVQSTNNTSTTTTTSNRNTTTIKDSEEKAAKQRKTNEDETIFSKSTVLTLKRGMKQSITDDNAKCTVENSRAMSRKIDSILTQQTEIYEKKMEVYEEYKKKVAKKLKEKLNYIEENYNTYLNQVKQCKDDMEQFIKKKSREVARKNARIDAELKALLNED